jgi:hypothetical protein
MPRYEYKYLVPGTELDRLRRALAPFVEKDAHVRDKLDYTVNSIYYDTPTLDFYHEKLAGIQHRKKVRIRGYNLCEDDSRAFLEIKRKDNMAISKSRASVSFRDLGSVLNDGAVVPFPEAEDEDAARFLYQFRRRNLRPVVLVSYDREAFFQKFDPSVRVTFDKHLRSSAFPRLGDLYGNRHQVSSLHGHFVLEIKFHKGIPSWLKSALSTFLLEREAVSKYTICVEAHGIQQGRNGHTFLMSAARQHPKAAAAQRPRAVAPRPRPFTVTRKEEAGHIYG